MTAINLNLQPSQITVILSASDEDARRTSTPASCRTCSTSSQIRRGGACSARRQLPATCLRLPINFFPANTPLPQRPRVMSFFCLSRVTGHEPRLTNT
jgi:hypothetical protein